MTFTPTEYSYESATTAKTVFQKDHTPTIIWDWNGTLLNDVQVCIASMNTLLRKHHLPTLKSVQEYRQKFCFPVEHYYKRVGFDFSRTPFTDLARDFIHEYHTNRGKSSLSPGSAEVLKTFKNLGYRQIIVSASQKDTLEKQTRELGVDHFFTEILGIQNIYARSKQDIARQWMDSTGTIGTATVLIGDTEHDYEVARHIGSHCILYSQGHQHVHPPEGIQLIHDLAKAPGVVQALLS